MYNRLSKINKLNDDLHYLHRVLKMSGYKSYFSLIFNFSSLISQDSIADPHRLLNLTENLFDNGRNGGMTPC